MRNLRPDQTVDSWQLQLDTVESGVFEEGEEDDFSLQVFEGDGVAIHILGCEIGCDLSDVGSFDREPEIDARGLVLKDFHRLCRSGTRSVLYPELV